jgi:hypothetical protein
VEGVSSSIFVGLAGIVAEVDEENLVALEREVIEKWQDFQKDGTLRYRQRIVSVSARK